ncbi:hypothetical protein [Adhaeribacter aquaticus]|uniref:hypothetical protein n=1 Tax=Adhaeribacter aquaticus TaxID=299567 RepID=UPI00041F1EDC|nr:hypothetical protein [Adhaeribacter aquaticus]
MKHIYKLLLLLLLLPLSCKTGKPEKDTNVLTKEPVINQANSMPPYENGSPLDSLVWMYPGIQQAMEENNLTYIKHTPGGKLVSVLPTSGKKTGFITRLFGPKKTKLKNSAININYQVASAGSSIAPATQTGNQENKEKLKGQNAIKGDHNVPTATKSDKSLLWVVIVVVIATIAAAYFLKRNNV